MDRHAERPAHEGARASSPSSAATPYRQLTRFLTAWNIDALSQAARPAPRGGRGSRRSRRSRSFSNSAPTRFSPTTITRATSPGWSSMRRSSRPSARTRRTKTKVRLQSGLRSVHHAARRRRDEEARDVQRRLQGLENALPIDAKYRNPKLGASPRSASSTSSSAAGDGNRGVQTAAYNLPNDERVIKEKGTKRVMLKNVQQAKFEKMLMPIAASRCRPPTRQRVIRRVLHPHPDARADARPRSAPGVTAERPSVRHRAQGHLQRHRGSQGRHLRPVGAAATRRQRRRLGRHRADDVHDVSRVDVRSIRFGINESHGKGIALQVNYLLDNGAVRRQRGRHVRVVTARSATASRS